MYAVREVYLNDELVATWNEESCSVWRDSENYVSENIEFIHGFVTQESEYEILVANATLLSLVRFDDGRVCMKFVLRASCDCFSVNVS